MKINFDRKSCSWSLNAGLRACGIQKAASLLDVNNTIYSTRHADEFDCASARGARPTWRAEWFFRRPALRLKMVFEMQDQRTILLKTSLCNESMLPLSLGLCEIIRIEKALGGSMNFGLHPEQTLFLEYCAGTAPSYVAPLAANGGKHRASMIGHWYNPANGFVLNASFLTFDRIPAWHDLFWTEKNGLLYRAIQEFKNYVLPAGAAVDLETMVIMVAQDPYQPLERWSEMAAKIYRPRFTASPSAGWFGWSWVDAFGVENYERVVLRNMQAIRRRLSGFGVDYIWINIGNLKDGLPGNWLDFNHEFFPHGMENVIKRMIKEGFKPGFWIAPFWVAEGSAGYRENKQNLLRNLDGTPVDDGEWPWDYKHPKGRRAHRFRLDGSHPATIAYLQKVFRRYRELGLRYFMVDFLYAGMIGKNMTWHDQKMLPGQVYWHAMQAIRRVTGKRIHLLSSTGTTLGNVACVDAARIGADYNEGRHLAPGTFFYPATKLINDFKNIWSHQSAIQSLAATWFTHGKLYLNDSNSIAVDKPIPRNEAEIATTVFGMSGGPMMIGDDIERLDPERLALIKKVLPRLPQQAFPADLFESPAPNDYPKIFVLPVRMEWGRWSVVAVFNLSDKPLQKKLTAAQLRMPEGRACWLYEFWEERYWGEFTDSFVADVPPGSCRVYRVEPARRHPWLLSTDMHIRQGIEIPALHWDARRLALSGTVARPRGERGNLIFIVPPGLRLKYPEGYWIAKDGRDKNLIVRKEISFKRSRMSFTVDFEAYK